MSFGWCWGQVEFKVGEIVKFLVVKFHIGVPVAAPAYGYVHHCGYALDEPREEIEALPVFVIYGIWRNIPRQRGCMVMFSLWIAHL